MKYKTIKEPEMHEASMPLFKTRNFYGYFQSITSYEHDGIESYIWQFYIAGFTDQGECRIMLWDRTYELISIDELGRIVINGKIYDNYYWNH